MLEPRVTVFIPTYNRARFLAETIRTVLDQTHQPVRVLVLDDASSDETSQVAATFSADPRFEYVRHETNVGMAGNWLSGRGRVRTPYFCLLNDDDLLAPDCIEKLLAPMEENPEVIVAFCDHHVIDETGDILPELTETHTVRHGRKDLPRGKVSSFGEAAVLHRSLHVSCSLLRTADVPPAFIETQAGGYACGYMFYQCFRTGKAAWFVPERLVSYRIHAGNMLSNPKWSDYISDGQIFWCRQMLRDDLEIGLREKVGPQISRIYCSHAYGLLSAGRLRESEGMLHESVALKPSLKADVGLLALRLGPAGRWILSKLRWLARSLRSSSALVMDVGPIFASVTCL